MNTRTLTTTILSFICAILTAAATEERYQRCFQMPSAVPSTSVNWQSTIYVPTFDSNLGILDSVTLTFSSTVKGTAQLELLATEANVTAALAAEVIIDQPTLGTLGDITPSTSTTTHLLDFDGAVDYSGSSGITLPNLLGTVSSSFTKYAPGDASFLALFTASGPSSVPFVVTAIGASQASGSGNMKAIFTAEADFNVTVCYNYHLAGCTPLGTATIGYYKKSDHWPTGVNSVVICPTLTYTKAQAIAILNSAVSGDKSISLAQQLIAAILNTGDGLCSEHSCVDEEIAVAKTWLCAHPSGSKVSGSSAAWLQIASVHKRLDEYNNGLLCEQHRN